VCVCVCVCVCVHAFVCVCWVCTRVRVCVRERERCAWFICLSQLIRIMSSVYGVATISRLLKMIGLFCRTLSLLQGSFAREAYSFKVPSNPSHPISEWVAINMWQLTSSHSHTDTQTCTHTHTNEQFAGVAVNLKHERTWHERTWRDAILCHGRLRSYIEVGRRTYIHVGTFAEHCLFYRALLQKRYMWKEIHGNHLIYDHMSRAEEKSYK